MDAPVQVLVVCTGNVCRSPLTERLMQAELSKQWRSLDGVVIHSAGTQAMVGHPMAPQTRAATLRLGGTPAGFVSRQLEPGMTRAATLVLGLSRAHRAAVVEGHPLAARYTFTLRELARLLTDVTPDQVAGDNAAERVRALAALAARRRGLLPPVTPEEDNVVDPYGGDDRLHDAAAAHISQALTVVLRLTAPPTR